jgi:MoxR-like ATPase/intein/homing endonuclease
MSVKVTKAKLEQITKEVLQKLDESNGCIKAKMDDPLVAELYPYVKTPFVRRNLARKGIFAEMDPKKGTMKLYRYEAKDGAEPDAEEVKAPKKKKVVKEKKKHHTYVPPHFHDDILAIMTDEVPINLWFVGPTGSGKCHTKGTKVRMFDGTAKNIEDVCVGDKIMGDDSKARNVLALGGGTGELYKVVPRKGKPFGVNGDHILVLWNTEDKTHTSVTVRDYLSWSAWKKHIHKLYRVGVDYPHKDVPVDPYFLGLWIGDGHRNYSAITNQDREIINYLYVFAKKNNLKISLDEQSNRCTSYMLTSGCEKGWKSKGKNHLLNSMRNLGIIGRKRIPQIYMVNSREVRFALLAGLIDSDGNNGSNCCEISQRDGNLAEQIYELAGSLGLGVNYRKDKVVNGITYKRIGIFGNLDLIPTKVVRKQFSKRRAGWKNPLVCGFDIESVGIGEYYGFTIDGNHLYLVEDFIVTHNTEYVHYLCSALGRPLYQIDGKHDMDSSSFLGAPTVRVDENTKQNYITWQDGPVVRAMQEGLDENGNEVGSPGILFIDEAASLPAHIAIGLNRLLGSKLARREITLDGDSGRRVVSHSGFRVICAANTIGRGLTGLGDAEYHAQADGLDLSTLRRFGAVFKFGYSNRAEKSLLDEKVGEDDVVEQMLKLRDAFRSSIKDGRTVTPFSTRDLVDWADQYRILGDIGKALYYSVFTKLQPEEVPIYNEQVMAILGMDILQMAVGDNDIEYM